jgi:hypothetical protein
MSSLFRKTVAGQAEVGSKAHLLPPRARSLLIMVDGKRTQDELRAMLGPAVDDGLSLLIREGLIELVPEALVSRPAALEPAPPVAAPAVNLDALRREGARALTDALGPMADALALRIETAKDAEQLRKALTMGAEAIENSGKRAFAEAFRGRFLIF